MSKPVSIIAGDCRAKLEAIPNGSVSLTVTSPPYPGMGMFDGDEMDLDQFEIFTREWLAEVVRATSDNGSIWINLGYLIQDHGGRVPLAYVVWPIARDLGLHLQQEVVWVKPARGYPASKRFTSRSERWMWFTKSPKAHTFNADAVRDPTLNRSRDPRNNPAGANPSDIWEFAQVSGVANDRGKHPCPFPTKMVERIIVACSNLGDVVLDPFAGSGTTALAALIHGRRPISIERDADFVAVTANRLLDYQAEEIARLKAELSQAKAEHERLTPTSEVACVEEAIAKSTTKADAVRALGWGLNTFSYKRLDRIATDHRINTSHFLGQGWRRGNRLSGQPPDAA